MPACGDGFKSCKFKGARKQWVAHCVRCGRRSADADWKLGIKPRPGLVRKPAARFSWDNWPVGVRFVIRTQQAGTSYGWVLTHYTKKRVWFYKPEYDQENRRARSMSKNDFEADVIAGVIGTK